MTTRANINLELFLTQCGLAWSAIEETRHFSLCNEWKILYGDVSQWNRTKRGGKAQFEYAHQSAKTFMIVPFLGNKAGEYSIGKTGPRYAAYECQGDGTLLDLLAFADMDFFIVPADFSWTIIHTHEDESWGGPCFIRKEWLVTPTRTKRTLSHE